MQPRQLPLPVKTPPTTAQMAVRNLYHCLGCSVTTICRWGMVDHSAVRGRAVAGSFRGLSEPRCMSRNHKGLEVSSTSFPSLKPPPEWATFCM